MLSAQELALLQWAAHRSFSGKGAIIDAGCFLGGSTAALAAGLRKSPFRGARIQSFDRFTVGEDEIGQDYIVPFQQITAPGSFRAVFNENIRAFADLVEVHEGDIAQVAWDGSPVEILFVDVAKTPAIDARLIRQFYPCLLPGQSLLIHQDFLWSEVPWLTLSMDFFRDYFEVLDDVPYATRLFRCIQAIPQHVADAFDYDEITPEAAEEAFERVRSTLDGASLPRHWLNRARFYKHRGLHSRVSQCLKQALDLDASGSVAAHLTDYFPEEMTGPPWIEITSQTLDPSFGLIAQLSMSEAQTIFSLIFGLAPKRVLEIGRARGGSTFVMASALRARGSGRLVSVDPNCLPEHRIADTLKERLSPWVDFIDQYAPYVLPEAEVQAGGKFDFAFLDGDHSEEACRRDLAGMLPHLEPGAFLLLHDAHFGGIQDAVATSLAELPLADRGSLISDRCETLTHIPYKEKPSYYGGLRLLQYVPPGFRLFDFGEPLETAREEIERLREENARLRRALDQNTRVWTG